MTLGQCGVIQPAHGRQTLKDDWGLLIAGITLGEDGVLIIDRVKKDDEGLYKCVAKNVEGVAKTSASITVHGKTKIILEYLRDPLMLL